ncbi:MULTISPECIES: hypothetical protein [Frankia]|uniref:hypothetical protein n=1 Tax=Frankia TaxID=1854 RepID=UPI0004610072|nr:MULTISPECIES: hypothetical protein [Frankia]KDA44728.1 hypothetical protein BMG523Draft_00248 [Frankia sp. BMG5.23]KEZ36410.1 hypothetical protein CEDDRAFT_02266 [Frankia sp. CeD]OFB45094.1 hypothetical protein Manayef4_06735 [Frankia sp. CgIM4]
MTTQRSTPGRPAGAGPDFTTPPPGTPPPDPSALPGRGSLAVEAALLADALRDWAASHLPPGPAGHPGPAASSPAASSAAGPAADDAAAMPDPQADPAPGPADHTWPCAVCPLCRLLSSLAGDRPEVVGHLLAAAGSLTAAFRAALGAGGEGAPGPATPRRRETARPASGDHPWPGDTTGTQPATALRPRVQRIDIT